jgi:NAD(P)-dependent dehydrogenase (short-subunit alcohol dehydrogenase family)
MNGIQGKVAIVTGGGQGIGAEAIRAFAREGAKVVISDVVDGPGMALADELNAAGSEALFVRADVTKEDQVRASVEAAVSRFGRLDFGVNNAGIGGASAPAGEYSLADWQRVIDINLTGVFLSMRYELPALLSAGGGVIVNVSSILGWVGFAGSPAYVAAKHGVIGLTKAAAIDYGAQNIRVCAVSPGFIMTPLLESAGITPGSDMYNGLAQAHAMKRLGTPKEVAELIVWLCSAEASFVTGSAVLVDGGYVAM